MHKLIREKGGAYGAFVSSDINRTCSLVSYRDPNYLKTFVNFESSVNMLKEGKFDEEVLKGAKLKLFQKLDSSVKIENKRTEYFYLGLTHEQFAEHRKQCLNVTKEDVLKVALKYFYEPMMKD